MVPNFALSLSFEGIGLLRHVDGAWAKISEVALDVPDLEAAVIGLREQATALDPEGAKVVLIIPNEQIRYLDAPDLGGDASARETAIRAALDGATPYDVDDLVHDHTQDRGRLLIAAVARETLDEAEQFARAHGFEGVSFAAMAPDDAFKGAVHFGKVKGWKGRVKRLPKAIVVVAAGDAAFEPVALPEPGPDPVTEPDLAAKPDRQATPTPVDLASDATAGDTSPAVPEPVAAAAQPARAPVEEAAPEFDFSAPPEPQAPPVSETTPIAAPQQETAKEELAPPAPDDADIGANLYFSTIRAALAEGQDAPKLEDAPRPEVKPRFHPVAEPIPTAAQDDDPAPLSEPVEATPAPTPEATAKPAPAQPTPAAPVDTPAPSAKELAARERAKALAARAPKDAPAAPPLNDHVEAPAAPGRRFTPTRQPDAELREAGVTSGTLDGGDDKPGLAAGAAGAAAAAMRFLSRRRSDAADTAPPPAAGRKTAPPLSATGAAPADTPAVKAPTLGGAAPVAPAIKPDAQPAPAKSENTTTRALGKIAALRSASLNKPAPVIDDVPADSPPRRDASGRLGSAFTALKRGKKDDAPAATAMTVEAAAALSRDQEAERLTIFGARDQQIGGKPRFLGLMLTAALLLFLVGVAAWASVFLQDGIAGLWRGQQEDPVAVASLPEAGQELTATSDDATAPAPLAENGSDAGRTSTGNLQVAALETAPAEGPNTQTLPQPIAPQALTPEQATATYAATGIWQRSPSQPMTPPTDGVDNVYVASIDPAVRELDAVALPDPLKMAQEPNLVDPGLPPPADLRFDFDERGLVRATPEGALTPDGLRIYTGLPPAVPPQRSALLAPAAPPAALPTTPDDTPDAAVSPLQRIRPEARPNDIIEQRERATFTGISRAELARLRPVLRPRTEQEEAVVEEPESPATEQAVAQSLVPVTRPRNMEAIVRRAERRQEQARARETRTASAAAAVAPRTVAPSGTTAGSVARAATVRNGINLGKVSLIGIYGTPSNRRAMVRLPNGKYQKVKVGDRLDGGRVSAIGESDLRYSKGGRNLTLKMPRG